MMKCGKTLLLMGYEMVKEYFSWELIAKEYINIYSTILKEHE